MIEVGRPKYGQPEIFNSHQGSQIAREAFTYALKSPWHGHQNGWQGGMARQHHRRAAVASIKYEEVYLHAYDSVGQAKAGSDNRGASDL